MLTEKVNSAITDQMIRELRRRLIWFRFLNGMDGKDRREMRLRPEELCVRLLVFTNI